MYKWLMADNATGMMIVGGATALLCAGIVGELASAVRMPTGSGRGARTCTPAWTLRLRVPCSAVESTIATLC